MDTIHYSRCRMMPTPSSLAYRLGLLDGLGHAAVNADLRIEFGDYDHLQDRLWVRHASNGKSLFSRSRGAQTRAIAFSEFENAWPVLVRADSGLRTPADLRGRRVLIPRVKGRVFDVERHLYLKAFLNALASAGLGLNDVEVLDIEFERERRRDEPPEPDYFFDLAAEAMAAQLREGKVDAIATVVPASMQSGGEFRVLYDGRGDPAPWARGELRTLIASEAMAQEQPEFLVELLVALLRAGQWAKANPGEIAPLLTQDLQLPPSAIDDHDVDLARWAQVDCSPAQAQLMRARKDYMRQAGGVENDFAIEDWIDGRFMAAAHERMAAERAGPGEARDGEPAHAIGEASGKQPDEERSRASSSAHGEARASSAAAAVAAS